MTNNTLASRIRSIMQQNVFTQKDLADNLGISQPAVSLYLKGRLPAADVLLRLAQLGNTSVEWLLTGEGLYEALEVVKERKIHYGNKYLLLKLWDQIPQAIQRDILLLLRHLVENRSRAE